MKYDKDAQSQLLQKKMPVHRKAYSDRTAWLMAVLSELAYIKFNPSIPEEAKDAFKAKLVEHQYMSLIKLINSLTYDPTTEQDKLEHEIKELDLELVATFDQKGTQAILVKSDELRLIALAFRGTESNSVKDIKTDLKLHPVNDLGGGRIHSGFSDAYEAIKYDIQKALDQEGCKDKPLFITGHSLGGALATLASKKISHKAGIAACYTFGSPRVGNQNWIATMKTPVYRVVNAADCVPMLPPTPDTIESFCWILDRLSSLIFIPFFTPTIKKFTLYLREKIGGYMHCGDMRYLTDCPPGKPEQVQLLYSVSFWRRFKAALVKKVPWKHFLSDHSIAVYRNKLFVIACRRNL